MESEPDEPKPAEFDVPLRQISTIWTMVSHAYGGPLLAEANAQRCFMERYHGAVYRYLLTALRNPVDAQELFQEFAVRFLRGDFKKFDPVKGSFRDYLRMALLNLIRDHRKRQASHHCLHLGEIPEPVARAEHCHEALDDEFIRGWRDEILARTLATLKNEKRRGGLPFDVVLKKKMQHPDLTSEDFARELNVDLKPPKPVSRSLVRKTLQLAREKFADLLVEEVAHSLGDHTVEQLEQELIDLGLISYCRDALELRWIIGS